MKNITRQEIFETDKRPVTCPDEYLKHYGDDCFAAEPEMKKLIFQNFRLQKALIEEYACMKEALLQDENLLPENFGFNASFFTCNKGENEDIANNIKKIYGTILNVRDEKGRLIGYQTSDTSLSARSIIKELWDEGKIDKHLTHFLSSEATGGSISPYMTVVILEKKESAVSAAADLKESEFYKTLICDIANCGLGGFFSNKFSKEELENDLYIRALMELGHDVYVFGEENSSLYHIIVK